MVKLADTIDLGSIAFGVQVQVLSGAPTFCRANMRGKISDFPRPPLSGAVVLLSNSGFISCVKSTAKTENLVHHYRFRVYLFNSAGTYATTGFVFICFQCSGYAKFSRANMRRKISCTTTGFTFISLTAPEYALLQILNLYFYAKNDNARFRSQLQNRAIL